MKILLIIISFFLILGCKTKRISKSKTSETATEQIKTAKSEEQQFEKVEQKQEVKKSELSNQKKETQTDIIVDGKAEDGKPLEIYNIQNGDTLQAIKVTGNAKVHVRAKATQSDQMKKENKVSELSNKVEEFSRNLVKEENLKETGKQINSSAKESVTRTGTFWSFGLIAIFGVVALVLLALFIYFKNYRKK